MQNRNASIVTWSCFAGGGTGALQNINSIIRREHYVERLLKQDLVTSVRIEKVKSASSKTTMIHFSRYYSQSTNQRPDLLSPNSNMTQLFRFCE